MVAICIFGSEARGSRDDLSDRDMLVCADNKFDLLEAAYAHHADGWTIQTMLYKDVRRLARRGSLFIHHLRNEGVITRDDGGILSQALDCLTPPGVDLSRIAQDMQYLKDIDSVRTYWERACLADIFFVFVRNAAINIGFAIGNGRFDYDSALLNLREFCCLSERDFHLLKTLRKEKVNYRRRKKVGTGFDSDRLMIIVEQIHKSLPRVQNVLPQTNAYQRLRLMELALLSERSVYQLDALEKTDPDWAVWQVICDPKPYPKVLAASALAANIYSKLCGRI